MIPFNKPYLTGKEAHYLYQAVLSGKISGDGIFTKKCHSFFEERYGFQKSLLTTSCTDALEMAAILVNIEPGDEVIAPSYTFVSTVNAFVLRGAKIVFVDCLPDHPNMDVSQIEALITKKTKVIIPVHYAGIACDMAGIMDLAAKYGLFVVEDAAQAIDSYFNGKPLGSIGHLAGFSFHETKNIISGEGGMLAINDSGMTERAEIIREKGTNRSQFFRGEVDKYSWVDIGSSFLPSDIIAAFLFAQLEHLEDIQGKRKEIWNLYEKELRPLSVYGVQLPYFPEYAVNNAHMFYLVCNSIDERTSLIQLLRDNGILSVFHYLSLHKSTFYSEKHDGRDLPETDRYADCLVRLPLFYELETEQIFKITDVILGFYHNRFSA
ncbi:dTDP-4-amino-4,6-dideoxygalactose transaminase [Dyadobacter sp. Leaf189]|uniref:dTDP-4-amino-4,6-dideoxygalactose transaminase n=1 Tax=Dyadobacter sp. Leaf189 TaxID=1736295 RepID=UPI0006F76307|nr:dTDP-4-amino-4,6-dideoxygalactose transaminase [Dyadobacter sp. Leaf189]KQS23914.1 TDP-4-oxo-6-deoxy-D-glucose aminotransferase [Dyadobacter sp. Leaf189]